MKKLIGVLLLWTNCFAASSSYAISVVKVICDVNGENVYIDGKFKTDCDSNEPVEILTKAGKHILVVKKDNHDGSYYYYKKIFRIGNGVQLVIDVNSNLHYSNPEYYYYSKAKKSGNPEDCWAYLKKFPKGKYVRKVKKIIDNYYWNRCKDVRSCQTYLSKVPWGIHKKEAQARIEYFRYKNLTENGIEGYWEYLEKFPKGKYVKEARNYLDNYYWKNCTSIKGCEIYLAKILWGTHRKEAKDRIDEFYFEKFKNFGLIGYLKYLNKFPNGKYSQSIRNFIGNSWQKLVGGDKDDAIRSIIEDSDGNLIAAGYTKSFSHGGTDAWVIKLNKDGNILWSKSFGRKQNDDVINAIIQAKSKNYVAVGYTESSNDKDKHILVVNLDKKGNKIWERTISRVCDGEAKTVVQKKNGSFIIAAYIDSIFYPYTWLVNLDKNGYALNAKGIRCRYLSRANSMLQTKNGNFIIAGYDRRLTSYLEDSDAWVAKLDRTLNTIWNKHFGELENNTSLPADDVANSVIQTTDNGYVAVGYTEHSGLLKERDALILKLDKDGNKAWDRILGGNKEDVAKSVAQTEDGGYIIVGYTKSYGHGNKDVWIVRLDKNGNKIWEKFLGGEKDDVANSIVQTKDGGFIIAGYTESFGHGGKDAWIIKLSKKLIQNWDTQAKITSGGTNR